MLHILTEDLAAFLSEVTQSDLECAVPCSAGDLGDLYLQLVQQNVDVATALTGEAALHERWVGPRDRAALDASVDPYYGGAALETGFRWAAGLVEDAFGSSTDPARLCRPKGAEASIDVATLYEEQIRSVVIHTWDVAQALGFPYRPAPDVTERILRSAPPRASEIPPNPTMGIGGSGSGTLDDVDAFARVLALANRGS